jgi:16S rRNA (guanine527-N7)-methyltransferase
VLCELALPLVRVGGTLAALVTGAEAAAAASTRAASLCGGGPPRAASASVLVVSKVAPTPAGYPRRSGLPARRPL